MGRKVAKSYLCICGKKLSKIFFRLNNEWKEEIRNKHIKNDYEYLKNNENLWNKGKWKQIYYKSLVKEGKIIEIKNGNKIKEIMGMKILKNKTGKISKRKI